MTSNRIVTNLTLTIAMAALAIAGISQSSAGDVYAQNSKVKALTGAWRVEAETQLQGTALAFLTFTSDGIVLADEPSSGFETTGHGNWVATGGTGVSYTFQAYVGGPDGRISASVKVVGALQFNALRDKWIGPFKVEVFDPSGNLIFSDRGTFRGARIQIESLN